MSPLDPKRTALILIDLQKGILARDTHPRPTSEVLSTSGKLAEAFRAKGGLVVLVHVGFTEDRADALKQSVDLAMPGASPPPGWDEIDASLQPGAPHTIVV